jgi:methylated-DNA-protein-cysteine methyltransferase-like protein
MSGKKHKEKNDFFDMVYAVTKLVPYGRVTSYGAIARYLGTGRSARVVGWALNGCSSQIPAHRVVNRNGYLTGKRHFGGSTMTQLLTNEGAIIEDDCILNFKELFWDPANELG